MAAQETAACGGITVLQDRMYPNTTHDQFPAMLYKANQEIDFLFIKEVLKNHPKSQIRTNTIKKCGFNNFQEKLKIIIKKLFQ